MPEKDMIATRDFNEVAKIHSDPKYASYRCEVVDGEYRFYAPKYHPTDRYVPLEQLEDILSQTGYLCLGHGTGRSGDSDEVVNSIFREGLRTKNNSLYNTTIGLSTPTPEIKEDYAKSGMPEPSLDRLKDVLNHWQHLDSKKIIIVRIPTEYINMMGDRGDADGELFRAFYQERVQPNGKVTYYLDPKFIVGCYDVEKQMVRVNSGFEKEFTEETIVAMKAGYKKALEKTEKRLERFSMPFVTNQHKDEHASVVAPTDHVFDSFDDDDDIEWDDPGVGKGK